MNRGIGTGRIEKRGKGIHYIGTFPDIDEGEEVVVMKKSDLQLIIEHEQGVLLASEHEMPEEIWKNNRLIDRLDYVASDGTSYKLYLERKFYSTNPRDMLFVRYVSVDEAMFEGELDEK